MPSYCVLSTEAPALGELGLEEKNDIYLGVTPLVVIDLGVKAILLKAG